MLRMIDNSSDSASVAMFSLLLNTIRTVVRPTLVSMAPMTGRPTDVMHSIILTHILADA